VSWIIELRLLTEFKALQNGPVYGNFALRLPLMNCF
jgi:hypothetical protein